MPDDYSNPLAPPDQHHADISHSIHSEKLHPLKNEDFRKLLVTPRVGTGEKAHAAGSHLFSHRGGHGESKRKVEPKHHRKPKHVKPKKEDDDDDLTEIMKNYRDRARERREGETTEHVKDIDLLQATAGYRAVAPDVKSTLDAAERRKQMIEESKYLGGDMEHTHLVKGLDYALLQKVRSEITSKEKEGEEFDKMYLARVTEREQVEGQIKGIFAKNIYNILFKTEQTKVNELFAPRRMAYVVELDDEYAETDIPTTLLRSKQECPVDEASTNVSINDIVIQKLTQVLAYLRTDNTKKKKKEKGKEKLDETTRAEVAQQNIFEGAGEYVPDLKKSSDGKKTKKDGSYFDRPSQDDEKPSRSERDKERKDKDRSRRREGQDDERKSDRRQSDRGAGSSQTSSRILSDEKFKEPAPKSDHDPFTNAQTMDNGVRLDAASAQDSYAECYPGGYECYDAAGDSDDEVDYSKMDLGNRKGPIRRWDFDTEQEYEDYMSRREALPKAAFQYGVKMNDGRKTRKGGAKDGSDQKAKIDRQWNKISKIISKRQSDGDGASERAYKKPKY